MLTLWPPVPPDTEHVSLYLKLQQCIYMWASAWPQMHPQHVQVCLTFSTGKLRYRTSNVPQQKSDTFHTYCTFLSWPQDILTQTFYFVHPHHSINMRYWHVKSKTQLTKKIVQRDHCRGAIFSGGWIWHGNQRVTGCSLHQYNHNRAKTKQIILSNKLASLEAMLDLWCWYQI